MGGGGVCGTREMVGSTGRSSWAPWAPLWLLWQEGQPIRGRQSPEVPPGSGPETILLKENFEAISTLKEPSRLVRSAERLALGMLYGLRSGLPIPMARG